MACVLQGWIQHDLVWGGGGGGGGGGGALPALVPSCVGHVCCPPINLPHYCKVLLDYCIWIVIVVHSSLIIMLLLKLLYPILPLIIFCFIMKNSSPLHPLCRARVVHTPLVYYKCMPIALLSRYILRLGWLQCREMVDEKHGSTQWQRSQSVPEF
jgi:hypothetical protein